MKRVRKIEAFFKALKQSDDPHLQLVLVRSCLGFARFNFALRTCSTAFIVNAIAAFDKAMLDIMEVIWNRGFSKSQRELACLPIKSGGVGLPWAFVLAWPIYVASRVQSQHLQSRMATAAQ